MTLELVREGQHGVQSLTSQKLQMQTMHPTSDREVKPSHQAGTLHTKTVTLNQPHHTMPLAPRFHLIGGIFTHKPQEEFGREKGTYNTQDAHTAENTPTTTPEQSHGEFIAQGCGRIAEFLAQAPWTEHRDGLLSTQSGIQQHLLLHYNSCSHLAMMMGKLPSENIPTAESNTLEQLHKISQQTMLLNWPGDRLQPEIITPGFDVILQRNCRV